MSEDQWQNLLDLYEEPVQETQDVSEHPPPEADVVVEIQENQDSDSESGVNLEHSASLAVMALRGITYMTGTAIRSFQEQCFSLMQQTASLLKAKDKFGLIPSQEINVAEPRFDVRQHSKRPRLETVQIPRSFQYVCVIGILKSVMSNPVLRNLIMSEKSSVDGYIRSFRDGSLYADLPPDLKGAIRIILYVDDLEILQGLSVVAGVYKVAGIYFGIQNLPPEVNALLTSIFVTALAYAADAKDHEVWEPFLRDMRILETEGAETLVDGEPFHFKAVLIAQIGDTDSAHQLLGLGGPSFGLFCRCCYVKRKEMWRNGLALGEPRTLQQHLVDASRGGTAQAIKTTGVRKEPLIHGLRFFDAVKCSVFDSFHDIHQGIAKMEVKLALRHYIHVKRYFTEQTLNSRLHFFDYGFPDRKNKPSAYLTEEYISNLKGYNLHLTGSQMWLFLRAFGLLFGDLVPEDDKFMTLISLLNQITQIVFAHAITESDLVHLSSVIEAHHAFHGQTRTN
ncbi:1,2-dihydroxy-3-keto-5-methylthiopentene dioxygenase [Frankliniella fusca]|uniref:1,2-dihydroxy-3-keto-5-methylthiopentene dioxygenase n=1 Tax=Frankliniella fusca TaxID=407009 RepID=A0AAE1I458_9NEOP|nr:1,2-dihydroxy-3-keto-5-methylthiopentene dioxygenase [Frankliniella fusca]